MAQENIAVSAVANLELLPVGKIIVACSYV